MVPQNILKPFEAPQRSAKIKISVNFLSSFGIGTGRVNIRALHGIYVIKMWLHEGIAKDSLNSRC